MIGQVGKRVTAADVARSLGISRATVGFVLNNTPGQTISERTRQRVLAEAERLGYRPHRAAQDLRRGSSKVILMVIPDWRMEYRLRWHLEEAALAVDEAGYSLAIYARQIAGRARPLWELLAPDVVLGLWPFDDEEVASMRACGVTRIHPDPEHPGSLDDASIITAGPALQVDHLHGLGHRRLAFAASADPRTSPLQEARVRAAERAAAQLGLDPLDVRTVDYLGDSATDAVRRWHAADVTGVVAYNDEVAATVVGAAIRAGLAVPGDLAVIGHDDTPLAAMFLPSISSVDFDAVSVGRHFAALALHTIDGRPLPSEDFEGNARVVARESTVGGR
ncbi:LacI family DNA-binding transcriptional regulator [Acrocarpospora macrocephala]|uniref:LacI family transcriptional regulator n=1 Tax=Acrocarpospora macrocephala TaxID=150177 RepID=A0A5M3WXG3_9ACTN|nr:LacI family DNA-binding transcriptional regulator [Acrocarpospora macrocephala]GES12619.1 LacI family transcriptional regulator [Acrocarpospora macrocephala]